MASERTSTIQGFQLRIYQLILLGVTPGIIVPVASHYLVHGVINVHQAGLSAFLWINVVIALWEVVLFFQIEEIEVEHRRIARRYDGRELSGVLSFFNRSVPIGQALAPRTWRSLWSAYSLFDPSYANRNSYGFWIDSGNGFTTLLPCLFFIACITWQVVPAWVVGVVGAILFYQMWYGTVLYFWGFLFNRRYEGHSTRNLLLFVGLTNGLWLLFPIWGMYASIALIRTNSYEILLS